MRKRKIDPEKVERMRQLYEDFSKCVIAPLITSDEKRDLWSWLDSDDEIARTQQEEYPHTTVDQLDRLISNMTEYDQRAFRDLTQKVNLFSLLQLARRMDWMRREMERRNDQVTLADGGELKVLWHGITIKIGANSDGLIVSAEGHDKSRSDDRTSFWVVGYGN